jgi:hypothetical protein
LDRKPLSVQEKLRDALSISAAHKSQKVEKLGEGRASVSSEPKVKSWRRGRVRQHPTAFCHAHRTQWHC